MSKRINVVDLAKACIPALAGYSEDDLDAFSQGRQPAVAATAGILAESIGDFDVNRALALSVRVWRCKHDVGGPTPLGIALEAVVVTLESFVVSAPIRDASDVIAKLKLAEDMGRSSGLIPQVIAAMRKLVIGGASAPDLHGPPMTFNEWARGM